MQVTAGIKVFQAVDMAGANIAHGAQATFPFIHEVISISEHYNEYCLQGSGPRIVNANSRSLSLAR